MDNRNFPDEINDILAALKAAFDGFGTNGFDLASLDKAISSELNNLNVPWRNNVRVEVYNPNTGRNLSNKQIFDLLHKPQEQKQILNANQTLLGEIFKFCQIKNPINVINSIDYSPRTNALILNRCKYTNNKIKMFIDKYHIDLSKIKNPEMFLQVVQTSIDQNKLKI